MNRSLQKKMMKQPKINIQPQKQNIANSQIESLLVSSLRYENNNYPYIQSQEADSKVKLKPYQPSLIKKQFSSNVFIEDKSYSIISDHCEKCSNKFQNINKSIQLLNLKLQQFQSKLNICFTKYGHISSKMSQLQIFKEEITQLNWQQKQKNAQISASYHKNNEQILYKITNITQQFSKIKKNSLKYDKKQNDKVCYQSKMIDFKLQKFRDEYQMTINGIIQTLEKVGNLQNKFIHSYQSKCNQTSCTFPDQSIRHNKKCFRSFSKSQKYRTNESTNISYSRNYQLNK